jgi:hypothetical protein
VEFSSGSTLHTTINTTTDSTTVNQGSPATQATQATIDMADSALTMYIPLCNDAFFALGAWGCIIEGSLLADLSSLFSSHGLTSIGSMMDTWGQTARRADFRHDVDIMVESRFRFQRQLTNPVRKLIKTVLTEAVAVMYQFVLEDLGARVTDPQRTLRLFDYTAFTNQVVASMTKTPWPFGMEDVRRLKNGDEDHTGRCVQNDSGIALLFESWDVLNT